MDCHRLFMQKTPNYTSTVDPMTHNLSKKERLPKYAILVYGCHLIVFSPSKTEFLWCATSRRTHHIDDGSFHFGAVDMNPSKAVRNLGVMMNGDLSMTAHVNKIVGQCLYLLRKITSIRRSLSTNVTVTLPQA